MKKILYLFAITSTLIFACQDKEETLIPDSNGTIESQSIANAVTYLMRNQAASVDYPYQMLDQTGANSILNASNKFSSTGRILENTDSIEMATCMTYSYQNEGSTQTTTMDWGEGCLYNGSHLSGKIERTTSYNNGVYTEKLEYFNFSNDTTIRTGIKEIVQTSIDVGLDSLNSIYYIDVVVTENLDIVKLDAEGNPEVNYNVVSHLNYQYNWAFSQTTQLDSKVTLSNGDIYERKVLTPLLYSRDCIINDDTFIGIANDYRSGFVSGTEAYKYTENGEEGTFEINYGNESCDNIISVTAEGDTINIDLNQNDWDKNWDF